MPAEILKPTESALDRAAQALLQNEVVGIPTETVYGLAGLGTQEEALLRIFQAKNRPLFDPLILHLHASLQTLDALGDAGILSIPSLTQASRKRVQRLMNLFWPGPLSLVLPRGPRIPDLATSGLPNVAIRMPNHPIAQRLLEKVKIPLAAPSANQFGRISPTTAQAVSQELGEQIDLIIDGGPCSVGLESSVVLYQEERFYLLRPGAVSRQDLEASLGQPVLKASDFSPTSSQALPSPGLLQSHYAPTKPLFLLRSPQDLPKKNVRKIGVLALSQESGRIFSSQCSGECVIETLSETAADEKKAWAERASRLFSRLRALDQNAGVELIFAECPNAEEGLAFAIRDRLERASRKSEG